MSFILEHSAFVVAALVIGGAMVAARLLLGSTPLRYERRGAMLRDATRGVFHVLWQAVGNRWVILPGTNAADLLQVRDSSGEVMNSRRLNEVPIDFVLCNPETLEPCAAIVLEDDADEETVESASSRLRREAFSSAGMPLLRIGATEPRDVDSFRAVVEEAIG